MLPSKYTIYKGVKGSFGAAQFTLQPPHFQSYTNEGKTLRDYSGKQAIQKVQAGRPVLNEGWFRKDGAVFLEVTSAIGPNKYDWDNKITVALSLSDIGMFLTTLHTGKKQSIYHDPNKGNEDSGLVRKSIAIGSPNGLENGIMMRVTEENKGSKKVHTVPLNFAEVIVLRDLLHAAIPLILGW